MFLPILNRPYANRNLKLDLSLRMLEVRLAESGTCLEEEPRVRPVQERSIIAMHTSHLH